MSAFRRSTRHRYERIWAGAIALAAAGAVAASLAFSQPPTGTPANQPGQPAANAPALPPGWVVRYTPTGGTPIVAHSPNAAFALRPGETIYPGVAPAGFEASYEAEIKIPEAGKYRFGA